MASEKETISKDGTKEDELVTDTNGENGNTAETTSPPIEKQKLSLGEIAAIDGEIAKAKTEQLQLLHNLFYGKNGSGPQIKRGIRKFAGFDDGDKQKKLDQLLTYDINAITLTATILDLQDVKKEETKETIAKAIVDFLMLPTGKTFEEVQKDEPEDEELSEPEPEEEEEEEEVKPKPKKGRGGNSNTGVRPKRATASRVWTNDYGSSEEEEIEEARPRVGRKKRVDDSDSGSDYNPSGGGSDSEGERRKSARSAAPAARPTRGGRRRGRDSESEEESEESEEELSEEEVAPAKKKKQTSTSNRSTPKRGATQKGRKRKPETESEEEVSEDEDEEVESEDSEKQKKTARQAAATTTKPSPQKKTSKGRLSKRAVPAASKKKRKEASSEEGEDPEVSEDDDEPLKKPPTKKSATVDGIPSDDDIKKLLKDILAEANLEEITMKTVCKKVYAHYPDHDLSQRKDFIKQTVKSLIAA